MKVIAVIMLFIGLLYFMDKLCLWLERKGWLYYRHKKPPCGAVDNALMESFSFLQPATRHTIELKQNEVRLKQSKSNVPGEQLKDLCYNIVKNEIKTANKGKDYN